MHLYYGKLYSFLCKKNKKIFRSDIIRIIAGRHRSRPLETLVGLNTRPMMDQMKESIFNTIGPYFSDEVVLDLFGGSGALSLEAISRGASMAYIVDQSKDAIQIIQKNVKSLKEEDRTKMMHMGYRQAMDRLRNEKVQVDIIFLDPPFSMHIVGEIVQLILEYELLKDKGIIICQYMKHTYEPTKISSLEILRHKLYGQNEVCIYQKG